MPYMSDDDIFVVDVALKASSETRFSRDAGGNLAIARYSDDTCITVL